MMGRQNAAVLPEPVSAAISTSPPPRTKGMPSACMSVGRLYKSLKKSITVLKDTYVHSSSSMALEISGRTPNSRKIVFEVNLSKMGGSYLQMLPFCHSQIAKNVFCALSTQFPQFLELFRLLINTNTKF